MTASLTMDVDCGEVAERMLKLTLEIIYLLTGEDYILVKTSGLYVLSHNHLSGHGKFGTTQSSMMVPPPFSLISENNNKQKVLEVTQKIIDLLTGEVPIRCQDVTVYFSMEEWEYLEGHKDLYKDVMMENQPPLTSPDGSSNGNPPERCPRPLYSRDSTQEDHTIPHHHQFENDVEDDVYMAAYQQCKEEEHPIEIDVDGREVRRTLNGNFTLSPYWDREDDITEVSPREDQAILPVHPVLTRSPTPSSLQESSADTSLGLIPDSSLGLHGVDWPPDPAKPQETVHHKALRGNKSHLCSFCGKQFTTHANVVRHMRTHTGDRPYSCDICGKSFTQKSILLNHQKVHTGDRPFLCPDCGKCFAKSSDVIRHRRVHTGERPYLCLECGKSFTQKFRLRNHQHYHNEEKLSLRGLANRSNQFT
ncbi:zinc finger protein 184-like isoform X2 [Lithobates pipiens]